jgi:hypothetical protein
MPTDDTRYRYFVTYPGHPEREVDGPAWRGAERAAGFTAADGWNATAGFTGHGGISGRLEFVTPAAKPGPLPAADGPDSELDEAYRELQADYPGLDWDGRVGEAVSEALEAGFQLGRDYEYRHPD